MLVHLVNPESAAPLENKKHGAPGEALDAGWYILRCTSGLDFLAEETLRGSGWDIFLPRERKWQPTRWRRRPREAEAAYPRFPGYLFIAIEPPHWPAFGSWPIGRFIRGILCMSGHPVPLAPGEIARLKAEDGTMVPHVASVPTHRAFAAGQHVRVLGGAFRDFVAVLDAIDVKGAHLTVRLFGRPAEVVLPLTWLEAA